MNRRTIIYTIAASLILTLLSILFFDKPIALLVNYLGGGNSLAFRYGTSLLELIFGFRLSKFALGFFLLLAGVILLIWKSKREATRMLFFIGFTQLTARLLAGMLKEVFERLRPFEVIDKGNWDSQFFITGGSSFPSGHAAHFWALYFPLALLFPRCRLPLLIVPVFISIARIGVNDHWLSDISASVTISALATVFYLWLFGIKTTADEQIKSLEKKS